MNIFAVRSLIALNQAIILYLLYFVSKTPVLWPATQPALFVPLVIVTLFVPLIIIQSIGNICNKTLGIWSLSATIILSFISYYAVFREVTPDKTFSEIPKVFFFILPAMFIAHALIVSGDLDRRVRAHYQTYFNIAWKQGVQVVLMIAFTAAFWLLLQLGAQLFKIIHLNFFSELINKSWFAIPATTLAIATALHVTDVKVNLIEGIRTLSLVLLSWLLPLITAILSLFLLSLFFTGLTPLWETGHASSLLMLASASLIGLINAAYQNGTTSMPAIQRYAVLLACVLLTPIVLIIIYSFFLRVQQYGWTDLRIYAAAVLIILTTYTCGYLFAVLQSNKTLKLIEACNVAVAFLIVAVYLALLTPIADPARLTVANQLSRLRSGLVTPEKFDFRALKFKGEKYGQEALQQLQNHWQGPNAEYVRAQAKETLALVYDFPHRENMSVEAKNNMIVNHTTDHPLPESFRKQDWPQYSESIYLPNCLVSGSKKCDAWVMGDTSHPLILIISEETNSFVGFKQNQDGVWNAIGKWSIPYRCKNTLNNAIAGKFKMVTPVMEQPDIEVMGWRTHFMRGEKSEGCE